MNRGDARRFWGRLAAGVAAWMWLALLLALPGEAADTATLLADEQPGPAVQYGLDQLQAALEAQGYEVSRATSLDAPGGDLRIAAGLASGDGPAAQLIRQLELRPPRAPESLLIQRTTLDEETEPLVLLAGADDRGLMYALLEAADAARFAEDEEEDEEDEVSFGPLRGLENAFERPYTPDRALSIYTMHRATFEKRFFDEAYWDAYLDMLARSRFNRFVLIFGYENWGYFAPPYPYFFDVEQFPDVRVVGMSKERQAEYRAALRRLIDQCHARGLEFTIGIWDHIYRGGVQGPRDRAEKPTPGVVWGLNSENLVPFTLAALKQFLQTFPEIDSIQFRMHGESGLRREEMESFWTSVYKLMKEEAPHMRFDARAKNFPDSLIDKALELGVPIRITTKYWMEQMGLPFHPTHIHPRNQHDRRHGYADLLRYPKRYDIHWRLWNGGTARLLLWGDPEYVRRFAESTRLYDGDGFEVNEMLATKMQDQPHEQPPFEILNPKYQYYDYEFQRYWHFFQVWGRASYNPKTSEQVWRREFVRRFGEDAGPTVEAALHRASWILPYAVAYCYPYHHFPTTRGWVARQRQDDLPDYAEALPSDTEQFLGPDQAAQLRMAGQPSAKIWPDESSQWFAEAARDVLELAAKAERQGDPEHNSELFSTLVDLRILARLAEYHSWRAKAGFRYALFRRSGDVNALDEAIACEEQAVAAWARIVDAAGDVYADDLMFGRRSVGLCGHWRDELAVLRQGLDQLRQERTQFAPPDERDAVWVAHAPVDRAAPGAALPIRATVAVKQGTAQAKVVYGCGEAAAAAVDMTSSDGLRFQAAIPADAVQEGLWYYIEAADGQGAQARWPKGGAQTPVRVAVTTDRDPPQVVHRPITRAPVGKPLRIVAQVRDPSGVRSVQVRFRHVTQFEDYQTLDLKPTDQPDTYAVEIPADQLDPQWDFMYFLEVIDRHGNGCIYPDLAERAPYVVVRLQR